MRSLKLGLAAIVALLFVLPGHSQAAGLHVRWFIDYEGNKPSMFTYVDSSGTRENYWYVTYTLKNNGEIDAPLNTDFTLRDERSRYYHMGYNPLVVSQIIAQLEHLTGLSKPVREERIAALKSARRYLDSSEQRGLGALKPGESLQGIAVFPQVALGIKDIDVLVLGLINPSKYRTRKAATPEEEKDLFELEPQIYKWTYRRTGASLYPQFDYVEYVRKEWIVKRLGTVSDKATIGVLIDALSNEDATIRKSASDLLWNLLSDRKGFDPEGTVEANRPAILLWREWWSRNQHKIRFDDATGSFVVEGAPTQGS